MVAREWRKSRPVGDGPALRSSAPTKNQPQPTACPDILADLADYLEHFRCRVLQDALSEATAGYLHRRAKAFDAARTRPGDYPGRLSADARAARNAELAQTAAACRHKASLAQLQTGVDPDVLDALREVS